MLKIRLMRIGAKKRPFYRVVVVDERNKRNGAYIELLGTYNPLTQPHEIKLKQERIDEWLKKGAQKSDGFLRILGEKPQIAPRKPKKEPKPEAVSPQPSDKTEEPAEAPAEETAETTETPVEEAQPVIPSESEESQDSEPTDPHVADAPQDDNSETKEEAN